MIMFVIVTHDVIHFMEGIVIEIHLFIYFLADTLFPWFASRNLAVNDNILPVNHYKQINTFYETKIMAIFSIQNGSSTALNNNVEL